MHGPSTPDAEKVAAVREALPAVAAGLYLSTAASGPLPAESAAAMAEALDWEVRTGRVHRDRADDVASRVDEARAAVAAILAGDLDDVAIASGLDDAFGRALRTIDWRPGDRIALVDDPATSRLRDLVPQGVAVEELAAGPDTSADPGRIRLLALPLVRATTGERLPVEAIGRSARARGSAVLVEASLALGAVPIDREALGADLLVARSDAWLLGPEGLAVVVGRGLGVEPPRPHAFHLPSVVGFARGCGWLSMYVGLPWAQERAGVLTAHAAHRLEAIDGVELLTPPGRATTLVFRVRNWGAGQALDELGRRIFLLAGEIPALDALQIGIGCWNTVDEIDRLAEAVGLLAAHTPETLPARPGLTMLGEAEP